MSPTSGVSHFASTARTSDEIHQYVTLVPIPDQLPSHVSPQQDMAETSPEPKFNVRKRRWNRNITAIFKDLWRQHKRKRSLGKALSVRESTEPSTLALAEPKINIRKRQWNRNIVAILKNVKDLWRQHRGEKPLGKAPGVRESIITIIKASRLNALLIFIPLSWIFHYVKLSNTLVFVFSFMAVVPLAKLLDFATDDLSLRLGQTLASLLNTTLGNAVDLIVAIIALVNCELVVVQLYLVGSILRNLLLVLGTCFFAGGTFFWEQGFGISVTKLDSSLLILSVIAVLIPAAFHISLQPGGYNPLTDEQEGHYILTISHGVAVILLFIYFCYIVFQFFSHKNLYDDCYPDVQPSALYPSDVSKMLHNSEPGIPPTNDVMDPDQRDIRSLEVGSEEGGKLRSLKWACGWPSYSSLSSPCSLLSLPGFS